MVEARLLRLDPALRRILRAASVYGGRFDTAGLEAVLGEASAHDALEALVARDWLTALEGGGYVFRQATSREAAYAMLVDEDKRLAHGRAAEHLAGHAGDPVVIAEHHERAQAPERAAPWWAKAATQALEANDFRGTIARAEAAERCSARGQDLLEALTARAEAHAWLNESPALRETAERLGATATILEQKAEALRWRSLGALQAGDRADLARTIEHVRDLAAQHPDHDSVACCAFRVAAHALAAGHVAQADILASLLEAAEPPVDSRSGPVAAMANRWRALRAHHAQELETSAHLHQRAAEQLRDLGNARTAAVESGLHGYVLVLLGANEEAARALATSLAECERLDLRSGAAAAHHNLGLALLGLGRSHEALTSENKAIDTYAQGANRRMECLSRDYASRILLALGLVDESVAQAEGASMALPDDHPYCWSARAALADALLARRGPCDLAHALSYA
jgi:hypothetical protein